MPQLEAPSDAKEIARAPASAKAAASAKDASLPLLSLLTFSPVGNPLSDLSTGQRNLFFDYLFLSLHAQRKEQSARAEALGKKIVLPASLSAAAMNMKKFSIEQEMRQAWIGVEMKRAEEKKAQQGQAAAEEAKGKKGESVAAGAGESIAASAGEAAAGATHADGATGATGVAGWKFSSLFKKPDEEKKGGAFGGPTGAAITIRAAKSRSMASSLPTSQASMGQNAAQGALSLSHFSSAYGQKAGEVSGAIEQMAPVIGDYARGNAEKERKVVGDLRDSLQASNFQADDLMASLLLVIEDDAWSGEEGGVGSSKPHGGATKLALVPQKLRSTAQDSAVVRLASVREMLRYYFRLHPKDYHVALAAALGMTSDQEEDGTFLQERLAAELASIGSFAFAQKLLAELKEKKKLGTKECLMKLGYRYDVKKKRLVLGKRTCGKPAEARGIVGLILSSAKK